MQIAFDDEIFLVDMFNFFHQCDTQTVQKRIAHRLFDDDHVTILCEFDEIINENAYRLMLGYGFKSDTSMLIASYPAFEKALTSGKTLLDMCLVHTDVRLIDFD